jgi:hypothetical protein
MVHKFGLDWQLANFKGGFPSQCYWNGIAPAGPSSPKCVISAQNQITSGGNFAYASAETKLATTSALVEGRGSVPIANTIWFMGRAVKLSKRQMKGENIRKGYQKMDSPNTKL